MIREYKKGDLSSGFVGMRVAVSVNGKLKQKYFSVNAYDTNVIEILAIDQENKWHKAQLFYNQNNVFSSETNTGIKGLHFKYDITTRGDRVYRYPVLAYQHMKNGKILCKTFFLKRGQLDEAIWFEVCRHIKNTRNLCNAVFNQLLEKKPV